MVVGGDILPRLSSGPERAPRLNPLRDSLLLPAIIVRHRELLGAFVRRELRARIEGSALGRIWPIAQPALLFVIYYLIFGLVLGIGFTDKLAPHDAPGAPVDEANQAWRAAFYLITGILPWTVLGDSLSRGTGVVLENANLIKKIAFPSELLPLYHVVVYHVYFLIGFVLLLGLELFVNGTLPATLAWLPLILLVQMMFISALTMFLSAANVFIRDIMQVVPIILTFWMFTTPVFYDLTALGAKARSMGATVADDPAANTWVQTMADWIWLNPMAVILDFYRAVFSYGKIPFPTASLFALLGVSAVLLVLCYAFFLACKGRFADEV